VLVSSSNLLRLGGLAAVAAATLILFTQLLSFLLDESVPSTPVVVNSVLKLLTFFLLLLGLVGLYAHQSGAAGPLGLAGFLAAFLGTMLLSGDLWLEAFAFPYLVEVAPRVVEQTPTGTLAAGAVASFITFAIGWVLFAVASLRARVLPRGGAILLIAGGVIGFGFVIVPGAGILLALAVGWMGFALRQSDL
jgi:hypothetical protein